jgi:hypothetical protein
VPVTIQGTNFVSGATVSVGNPGIAVSGVTVVSATQITATFTVAAGAALGAANVTVTTSGGISPTATFTVTPPPPTVTMLSPGGATAGGAGFTLTIYGTNFVPGAVAKWNGSALTTTFVSATQLTAAVPASAIATAGTYSITVTTSGGTSSSAGSAVRVVVQLN